MNRLIVLILILFSLNACNLQGVPMSNRDYTQIYPPPKAFDPKRTQYTCAIWTPPSPPDAESHLWYRAATLIHAEGWRKNTRRAQDMIILYEAAASRGHYQAINNLYLLYTNGHGASGTLYAPLPSRARKWLHYGLDKNWAMANYWLFDALYEGNAGYHHNPKLGLAYLQKAVDLGVPLAQYELSLIYDKKFKDMKNRELLLECAARQGFSAAMNELSRVKRIRYGNLKESLQLMHNALRHGGEGGGEAALKLTMVYAKNKALMDKFIATPADPVREAAYAELEKALMGTGTKSGNPFYTFPRLDEVLPLPPAKTHWKGIYSAMSKEDAAFYQNPPDTAALAADILKRGIVKKEDVYWPPRKE
ncbi:MAG: sel1 repeat family protein [Neisseria sp.]|nr:MAG: sel1 repeat family protein [Neisseria sp.]